jgi:hypothetical protein
MKALWRIGLVAASLSLGLGLPAREESEDEPAADVPVGVEKDLFHPPVRLAAADGIIDRGDRRRGRLPRPRHHRARARVGRLRGR